MPGKQNNYIRFVFFQKTIDFCTGRPVISINSYLFHEPTCFTNILWICFSGRKNVSDLFNVLIRIAMSIHIGLSPRYEFLRSYVEDIPQKFNSLGEIVHKTRNVIRVDVGDNVKLVIKSYRKIYLFNQFFYAHILPSKAKRAYLYAKTLIDKGFKTPEPVAYIECIRKGLMQESYFISTYTDYRELKYISDMPQEEGRMVLDALAQYTHQLHQQDIYHKDYSVGNILFKKNGLSYDFTLVDNNRMKFSRSSFAYRMKNLRRLDLPLPALAYLCQEYARLSGENELLALATMLNYRKKRMLFSYRKGKVKYFFRRFLSPQLF